MNADLDELEEKIRAAKGEEELSPQEQRKKRDRANHHMAAKAGFEFVASVFICAALGYFLDQQFDSKPLLMILFFFLGVGVGFLSLFRLSKNMGSSVGYAQLHKNVKKDVDDGLHQQKKDATSSPDFDESEQD